MTGPDARPAAPQPGDARRGRTRPGAGGAAAGTGALASALFTAAHFYWAAGGRFGLDPGMAPISARTWFLLYDLAAGLVFLTAACFGLILATGRTRGRRRRLLLATTCCGAVLALLRGGIGVIQDLIALIRAPDAISITTIYDLWFTLLGVLFLLASAKAPSKTPSGDHKTPASEH